MDKINTTIQTNLTEIKIDINKIEPNIMKHLINIETVFTDIFDTNNQLMTKLKENKPSILTISKKCNIARQTIYNNPLLKDYIELRLKQFNLLNVINTQNINLSQRVAELEEMLIKMQARDVNEQLLKNKVSSLEDELNILKKQNLELLHRYKNATSSQNSVKNNEDIIVNFPKQQ
jgi:hypothetical protein